jgi:hypothetical protein
MWKECLGSVQYTVKKPQGSVSFHLDLCSYGRLCLAVTTSPLLDLSMGFHPSAYVPHVGQLPHTQMTTWSLCLSPS